MGLLRGLIRTIERFAHLSRAHLFAYKANSGRAAKAGLGKQPKKRIELIELDPIQPTIKTK